MSKEKTGQEIVALHGLLTQADNKEQEAETLCINALALGILSLTLIAYSRLSTALELDLKLGILPDSGWLRTFLVTATCGYGMSQAETWAIRILNYLRPNGIFTGITTHPAHAIKHLYCVTTKIKEHQQSLQPMVSGLSGLLTALYFIGAFICFALPLLRYFMEDMNRPEWGVDDPLAGHASTCFEQHCIEQFHSLGTECILACQDTLQYTVGQLFKYNFEGQSMFVTYTPEQQAANQEQAQHLIKQFLQTHHFSATEQTLRIIHNNRQRKQNFANKISTDVIRSNTIPTPKLEVTYAGIMLKLAPRVERAPSPYDQFLNGLQATWQNILFAWLWNYVIACRGINQFKKRMGNVISNDCSLQAIEESSAKKTTVFRIDHNTTGDINIGYGKRVPAKIYFIELHRALMEYGFSTYHINGVLHFSYQDISEEESLNLKAEFRSRLASLYNQHHASTSVTANLNDILKVTASPSSRSLWSFEIFNYSGSICLLRLDSIGQLFHDDTILKEYLNTLTAFFDDSARIIANQEEDNIKIIYIPNSTWSAPEDITPLQTRMRVALATYQEGRKKTLPAITDTRLFYEHKPRGRAKSKTSSSRQQISQAQPAPAAKACRSIDFGGGIGYYATKADKGPTTTCRAYPIQVDWLESGRVFACIPEQTMTLAIAFTTRKRILDILRRGSTHGRKALNTGNSAQGIQIESQPYQDAYGRDHTGSFGKIKTTGNIGIFGSMRDVTAADGERYHLVTFDGIPGLRH